MRPALAAGLVALALVVGCTSRPTRGILLDNQTGERLAYVYLVPDPRADDGADVPFGHEIDRVRSGVSSAYEPAPERDGCTVAPLVARLEDGTEVARLPEGTCWDPVYRWTLDEGDLPD